MTLLRGRTNRFHTSARLGVVALVAALSLSGCGSDSKDDAKNDDDTSSSSNENSDAEEGDAPPAADVDVCGSLTPEAMSEALGGPVTVEEIPGGGCNFFNEDDPRALSAAINESTVDDYAGGFEGTRTGITAVIDGEVEDLDGVGDDAFLVIGSTTGGSSAAGAGAVLLGDTVVQVTVLQASELSDEEVHDATTNVLTAIGELG